MDLINGIVTFDTLLLSQLDYKHTVVVLGPVPAHCHIAENEAEFFGFSSLRETFQFDEISMNWTKTKIKYQTSFTLLSISLVLKS